MSENKNQNNIKDAASRTYPLPNNPAQIGQLIGELSAEDPRAVIIDYFQAVVVFHPRSVGGKPELTEQSIPYLLANYPIEMLLNTEIGVTEIEKHTPNQDCIIALNTTYKNQYKGKALWTNIITPNLALIIQQKTDQSDWKILGLSLKTE
jgi:hypothetical protein